jgi:sulfur carrier protein
VTAKAPSTGTATATAATTVQVTVNGQPRELPAGTTVTGLREALELRAERVAVEVNAQVVRRARHAEQLLAEGDQVEIVTFVGGG